MAKLLVSVRSVIEARAALRGGAAVIDIKEPSRGPLGRARAEVWRAIRLEVPEDVPVSVALGELADLEPGSVPLEDLDGIAFRKVGPARMGQGWTARWDQVRRLDDAQTGWVAVAYADWERSEAPNPDDVIAAALLAEDCPGVLIDTWDKTLGCPIEVSDLWRTRIARVQGSGRFVALAGRLDLPSIRRLSRLRPDLFAVRGAACVGARRDGVIDAALVAELAEASRVESNPGKIAP